ncbi:MAG: SAM-dependent chlorinase/fluorinase [Gloeobacterales cyanobacterium]
MTIVTLLSDYGIDNSTVGVLKGFILSAAPETTLVDLSHQLPSQDLLIAQFELGRAYRAFPKGTVHLAIVDPGIASKARPIAFQAGDYFFVGPDNGLFETVLEQEAIQAVISLKPLPLSEMSGVFHGRDCYAPAAAHLSLGKSLHDLGQAIDSQSLKRLDKHAQQESGHLVGWVQRIDPFGNLITNVPNAWVLAEEMWRVRLPGHTLLFDPHKPDPEHKLQVRPGSIGFMEIAFEGESASEHLKVRTGCKVEFFKA